MVVALGPKLSEKVVFLWKFPRSEVAAGSIVTLRVWQKQLREMVVTYGRAGSPARPFSPKLCAGGETMTMCAAAIARRVALPLTAVLVTAAALLWHRLPVPTQIYAPFDVHGDLGNRGAGPCAGLSTVTGYGRAHKQIHDWAKFTLEHSLGDRNVVRRRCDGVGAHLVGVLRGRSGVGRQHLSAALRAPPRGFGVRVDPGCRNTVIGFSTSRPS